MTKDTYIEAVNRNNQRLFLLALSYIHNHDDAEDIMQNCYLKLWKQQKQWKDDEHIDKWLTLVCINECKNLLKSKSHTKWTSLNEAKELYSFDTEHDSEIFQAVMSLSENESIVIHMFYFEGYSVKEISKLLNISESAVKIRLHRGRDHLSTVLKNPFATE